MFVSFSSVPLFADMTNRGRLDSEPNDFSMIIMAIIGIGLGGFLAYALIGASIKDGFKDKETNKWGCLSIILCILSLLVLVAMCSD